MASLTSRASSVIRIMSVPTALALALPAGASLWSTPIAFPSGTAVWANQAQPNGIGQHFDILKPTGSDPTTGKPIYAVGTDGVADLTITTKVYNFNGSRWASVQGGKTNAGLEASTRMDWGTSRSGDAAMVSMELRFDAALMLTAGDFAMQLISANGTSALYEWTMITLGTANQSPFDPARINDYTALDYNNTGSGTYYNSLGSLTGNAGTEARLGTGRSISQFLAGTPGTAISGGLVQPGWYSIDDFNAIVFDAPEAYLDNPFPGDGAIDDNQNLTGTALGLNPNAPITSITVWFGGHDVAFDSDGDGFTTTETNIYERIAALTLGTSSASPVPEPGFTTLLILAIGCMLLSRRR
jgi:hypothetical protein